MPKIVQAPSFTQAVEMMPQGPDRDEVFARFAEIFDRRGGNSRARSLRVLEKTRDAHERWLDEHEQNPQAKAPVGAREGLRATMAIDKAFEKLEALRNECFRQALEEFYRQHGFRACVPAWKGESYHPDMQATDFLNGLLHSVAGTKAKGEPEADAAAVQAKRATPGKVETPASAEPAEPETITLGTITGPQRMRTEGSEAGIADVNIVPAEQAMTIS